MLTYEENELLTRIGPATMMGDLFRRSWLPVCIADEIEADGAPLAVRLLGEDLVAFRDTDKKPGLLEARCPHRLASLALGRNEEGGLRCIYHGWKFDVRGGCVEMPTEPDGSSYRVRLHMKAYPVREHAGLIWGYLGPAGTEPPLPDYGWTAMPAENRVAVRVGLRANYAQGMEGSLDSAHSWFLHRGAVRDWKTRSSVSSDLSPRLEAEDTPTGFRYAAIRRVDANPDTEKYVRTTVCIVPFSIFIPPPLDERIPAHIQMFVPIDDDHAMFYGVWFSQNGKPVQREPVISELGTRPGIDLDAKAFRFRRPENHWLQDRAAMKGDSYVGVEGVLQQDFAAQESLGPIVDRTREHLGTSDVAVIRFRRRMLEAARALRENGEPLGRGVSYASLRAEQQVVPIDVPWQDVGSTGSRKR